MQDEPTPAEILQSVSMFLRDEISPQLTGNLAFHLRVAANAIDLVRREISFPVQRTQEVTEALRSLLGRGGSETELNAELARQIANRTIDLETPGLQAFLWSATEAKLSVDQPNYAGLRLAKELRARAR